MNEKINHNKIIDYCEECIRYKNLQPEKCINCGTKSVELILEGPSMIGKCTRCGNSFVGASFFAPCETDFTEYVLKIEDDNLSNDQIILLQKLLHIAALELKNFLQNKECIDKKFTLKEINEITKVLNDLEISYIVEPQLQYSKYDFCVKKIF